MILSQCLPKKESIIPVYTDFNTEFRLSTGQEAILKHTEFSEEQKPEQISVKVEDLTDGRCPAGQTPE